MAALAGTTGVGAAIYRSRTEALGRNEGPCLLVEPVDDSASTTLVPFTNWVLTVQVAVVVRGDVPDQLADPIVQSLHSKLMADETLGGYAQDMLPVGVQYDMLEGETPIAVVRCTYRIAYRSRTNDLTAI